MNRSSSLGLLLTLASLCAPHGALADASPNSSDDSDLGVYMLRNQDLNPSLAECLTDHALGYCLKKNLVIADTNPEKTNSGLVPSWDDFLKKVIGVQDRSINGGNFFGSLGGSIAITRLDTDEIVSDPNKIATDQKLGTPGIWAQHLIELIPQFGFEQSYGDNEYAGGILSFHGVLRLTYRHPMDQIYNTSFSGFTRSEIKILEQLVPMYLKVPSHITGSGMLPGEGLEIERYDAIEIGSGPLAELFGDPTSWYLQAGIFGSAGPTATFVRGHFRTIMEVQADQTVRVELEKISEQNETLEANVDVGFKFSPFTLMNSLINIEQSFGQAHKTIFDMLFDTSYSQAAHALKMAYLGKFSEALNLAAAADTNYQGARRLQTSTVKERSQSRDLQIFVFNQQSELVHDDIDTTMGGSTTSEHSTVETSDSKRHTLISDRNLELTFQNSNGNALNLKYTFQSKNAKQEEVQEFMDLARALGPTSDQAQIDSLALSGSAKTKLDGYFYLSLDTQAFGAALGSATDDGKQLITAWATILNLPNPQQWAGLSESAQNELADKIPGAKKHLQHFRNFVKALKKTIENEDPDKQAKTFVKSFRGEGTDLYPLAALANITDKNHIMTLELVNVSQGTAKPNLLQFENIGSQYINPNRLIY